MFCLGKGAGFLVCNYIAQKFMQISGIHAAAYPSGEFRHGPLSMIDDVTKTPGKCDPAIANSLFFVKLLVIFMVLNDEHRSQIMSNILQVKERGATTIVFSALEDISTLINLSKIDFLI